jgi:hypothetical protein
LYKLNSDEAKTCLGITLKVMAGDKIGVHGKSYYLQNNSGSGYDNNIPVIDLLTAFLGAPTAAATTPHGIVTADIIGAFYLKSHNTSSFKTWSSDPDKIPSFF